MTFTVAQSSVKKGESLLDTVQTIEAMGIDAIVVRHPRRRRAAPHRRAGSTPSVINAGDGRHEHPTQALLDALTLRRHRGPSLDGLRVAIVGDVRHSRVARSNVKALAPLGADVTLVAPPTLLPESLDGWPVRVSHDLDDVSREIDVVYAAAHAVRAPAARRCSRRCASTPRATASPTARAERLKPDTLVMHPGPMNRGRRDRGRRSPTARVARHASRSPTASRCAWPCSGRSSDREASVA